jgi:Carboxypeptidase regulatory-like domain
VTNTGTNVAVQSRTDGSGIYVVPFLQPATYTVTAKQNGFEPAGQTNIMLHMGGNLLINFTLKVVGAPMLR